MDRDKILRLAREAGFTLGGVGGGVFIADVEDVSRLIALVRAETLEEAARECDDEARLRTEAGNSHSEDSESRSRCYAGARAAMNCGGSIRALLTKEPSNV